MRGDMRGYIADSGTSGEKCLGNEGAVRDAIDAKGYVGICRKLETVIAGVRGDRSVRDLCREHDVSEALYYSWRDKILEGGKAALSGKDERQAEKELRRKIGELERVLGRKTYELEIAGEALRGWE